MKTYPIMLDVRGKPAVVVGGGPVGLRKVRSLRDAGAVVRLVALQVAEESDLHEVELLLEDYRPEALVGAALVFACTDDRELNARIARDARQAGALVNAADQPEDCDFYLPAVAADGEVVVAVGTGGGSPALAAALRDRLASALPERVGAYAAELARLRETLQADVPDAERRGEIFKALAGEEAMRAFQQGGPEGLFTFVKSLLADKENAAQRAATAREREKSLPSAKDAAQRAVTAREREESLPYAKDAAQRAATAREREESLPPDQGDGPC